MTIFGIELDTLLKGAGVLISAFVAIMQLRKLKPGLRTKLKAELEILNMLDKGKFDSAYPMVKSNVDTMIEKLYFPEKEVKISQPSTYIKRIKIYNWPIFIIGLVFLIVFAVWTIILAKDGNWWALLTGFLAFSSISNIINGLKKPKTLQPKQ